MRVINYWRTDDYIYNEYDDGSYQITILDDVVWDAPYLFNGNPVKDRKKGGLIMCPTRRILSFYQSASDFRLDCFEGYDELIEKKLQIVFNDFAV